MNDLFSQPKAFLIDGMSLLFRSYYAMGRVGLTSPDGKPIGAIYGFLRILIKILKEQNPTYLAVAWDRKEKTFRHEAYTEYKANRSETPEDLLPQIFMIQELLPQMGIPSFSLAGFEADDLIGTFAKQLEDHADVFIVTSDKDFMQIVNEKIKLFSLKTGDNFDILGPAHVKDYFGCYPEQVIDILAIRGDAVDNVPGVKGIGPKGASKLIEDYGSLEKVYENLENITNERIKKLLGESRASAFLSKKLVIIDCNVPLNVSEQALRCDIEKVTGIADTRRILTDLKMITLLKTLFTSNQPTKEAPKAARKEIVTLVEEIKVTETHYADWKKRDYKTVKNLEELKTVCNRLKNLSANQFFAFDTETTGLDSLEDKPVGLSLCFEEGEGYYIPLHETHLFGDLRVDTQRSDYSTNEALKLLEDAFLNRSGLLVAHNLKFDAHQMLNIGIDVCTKPYACSMVAAWMCDASSNRYGLDDQTLKRLQLKKIPTSNLIGRQAGRETMLEVPLDQLSEYACEDVDATFRLWELYAKELKAISTDKLFWECEMPLLKMLLEMEREGVFIDANYLKTLELEISQKIIDLEQKIFEMAGSPFNVSSPRQLGQVMFEVIKVHEQTGYKGKLSKTTIGYKTDAGVLDKFASHPFVSLIQEHRELSKLQNTYIVVLPKLIKRTTGRVHTHFQQTGTATGRLSSYDPNLQNIPVRTEWGKKVRHAFTAHDQEHVLISADYSQIELRVLASMAEDPSMITAFAGEADIHRETAAKLLGKNPDEVSADERSKAKAVNFGIIYGMGAQRLSQSQKVSLNEAKAFIERYFLNFSQIREFLNQQRDFAHNNGFVSTLFGRVRKIYGLKSPNMGEVRAAENIAINTPIQGTAADIMKFGMLAAREKLKKSGLKAKILLQVHDELLVECPKNEVDEVSSLLKESMSSCVQMKVPLLVEVGSGHTWLEAK